MRRSKKIWLKGLGCGIVSGVLLCGVGYTIVNERIPFVDDALVTGESGKKLSTIETIIDKYYYQEVDKDILEEYMYYGVMMGLQDRYSGYYSAEQYADAMQSSEGVYVGIGLLMEQDPQTNVISVSKCYEGSPAYEVGILAGDIIYKVNEYIAAEKTLSELGEIISAEESVVLYIQRDGVEELMEMEVSIEEVEVPSVYHRMLNDSMGYIQIAEFTDVTSEQFRSAYEALSKQGMKGLMIDLRENPGGLLSSVCNTLRQILPEGLIVYMEDKNGKRQEYFCKGETPIEIPLVLLINENSASAAEVFSGAVKDYEIGTLVGTTTFGKGIVQQYFPMYDGSAIKLTVSSYYTPDGVNIHGVGIAPDVEVTWDGEEKFSDPSDYNELSQKEWEKQDNQFEKAVEVLAELIQQEQ